jgi:hypothetical protein
MPRHEWDQTRLRFEYQPGKWGKWTDLQGPQGPPGRFAIVGGGGGSTTTATTTTAATSDASVPYFVASTETFTVPLYRQALFARTIDCEGIIDLSGDLILVN